MSIDTRELEMTAQAGGTETVEGEIVSDDDQRQQDMIEAFALLTKSMHLLAVLADVDFCKRLNKKERGSMQVLSDKIKSFLDDAGDEYEEMGEEDF